MAPMTEAGRFDSFEAGGSSHSRTAAIWSWPTAVQREQETPTPATWPSQTGRLATYKNADFSMRLRLQPA